MEVPSPFTHQERTDGLIRSLRDVLTAYHTEGDAHQPLAAIGSAASERKEISSSE
jgi:predicted pyridoxine 5'-phosphate oxidase superfamily flavin-nucleotide-binding protein